MKTQIRRLTYSDTTSQILNEKKQPSNFDKIIDIQLKEWEEEKGSESEGYSYEEHRNWLTKKAKDDIVNKKRVCFVALGPIPGNWEKSDYRDVVASVMIKKSEFSDEVELKNLYVYKSHLRYQLENMPDLGLEKKTEKKIQERIFAERETIQKHILNKVEQFCQKRGFSQIEVSVPVEIQDKVRVFLGNGYQFDHKFVHRRSNRYTLIKPITPAFVGDAYNMEIMTLWVLRNIFSFDKCMPFSNKFIVNEKLNAFTFEITLNNAKIQNVPPLNGIWAYTDDEQIIHKDIDKIISIFDKSYHNKFLFIPSVAPKQKLDAFKGTCRENGIYVLDKINNIYPLLGKLFKPITKFPRNEIQGLLIQVTEEFLKKAKTRKTNFKYNLLNGVGSTLFELNIELNEEEYYLFYYSSYFDKKGIQKEGIVGFSLLENGEFISSSGKALSNIYKEHGSDFLFSKDEFETHSIYYSNLYDREQDIVMLDLERVRFFEEYIDLKEEKNVSRKLLPAIKEIKKEEENFNNIYLDKETVEKWLKYPTKSPLNHKALVLSYCNDDITDEFISELADYIKVEKKFFYNYIHSDLHIQQRQKESIHQFLINHEIRLIIALKGKKIDRNDYLNKDHIIKLLNLRGFGSTENMIFYEIELDNSCADVQGFVNAKKRSLVGKSETEKHLLFDELIAELD